MLVCLFENFGYVKNTLAVFDLVYRLVFMGCYFFYNLAFGLELTLETTERFLMLAGYRNFYPRHKRDSLLKYAFLNNMNISEADSLLVEYGFSVMTE